MGMPRNLFLVRHGQSEGNLVHKHYRDNGNKDVFTEDFMSLHESQYKLTDLGIEQAKKAGEWINKWKYQFPFDMFSRLLVSGNVRALQTAAYLNIPQKWMIDFNLRERDHGLINSLTPDEKGKYANELRFENTQPFNYRPPQGESMTDVCQRIKIVLDTLARECDGENVIIVCHGHVMRVFQILLERMSPAKANELFTTSEEWGNIPNCSIIHYTREDPNTGDMAKYLGWMRKICPAGGGESDEQFIPIERKKFSNEELLLEAEKLRGQ